MKDKTTEKPQKEPFDKLYSEAIELIKQKKLVLSKEMEASFLQFKQLSNTAQIKLIDELSLLENLPQIMLDLIKLKQFKLDVLPGVLLQQIGRDQLLTQTSFSFMAQVNKKEKTLLHSQSLSSAFLRNVAFGKQDKAEEIFTILKQEERRQEILRKPSTFIDYSGREFNCTAYEYAYWAMDTHMCRMLEKHMDADTKAEMLKRCKAIEENGLTYKQHRIIVTEAKGVKQQEIEVKEIKGAKHFDLTPLKTALQSYVYGYEKWEKTNDWEAMKTAWMRVGIAQRDVPVHVANEYCRKDRSFDPTPTFKEDKLPRELTFYNYNTGRDEAWFPLVISDSSGLAVDFALIRADVRGGPEMLKRVLSPRGSVDLAAIGRLNEVRTADLTQSRENLKSIEPGLGNDSCRIS